MLFEQREAQRSWSWDAGSFAFLGVSGQRFARAALPLMKGIHTLASMKVGDGEKASIVCNACLWRQYSTISRSHHGA